MNKETMRLRLMELETALKDERPHDGFTLRLGLPNNGRMSIVASIPMIQTTLGQFAGWDEDAPEPVPDQVYDFHITVHPALLKGVGEPHWEAAEIILTVLRTNYPSRNYPE